MFPNKCVWLINCLESVHIKLQFRIHEETSKMPVVIGIEGIYDNLKWIFSASGLLIQLRGKSNLDGRGRLKGKKARR